MPYSCTTLDQVTDAIGVLDGAAGTATASLYALQTAMMTRSSTDTACMSSLATISAALMSALGSAGTNASADMAAALMQVSAYNSANTVYAASVAAAAALRDESIAAALAGANSALDTWAGHNTGLTNAASSVTADLSGWDAACG